MVTTYRRRGQRLTIEARGTLRLLSQDSDHPNKIPFEGVLTRVDEPSDKPPNGSHGHRVLIPNEVAARRLDTLKLMSVNYADDLANHEAAQKVGIIEEGQVEGRDLVVRGFLYAKDLPKEVDALRARSQTGDLGMSFEIADVAVEDPSAEIWTIRDLVFTGAAILKRTAAAYMNTSFIAASAQRKEMRMKKLRRLRHTVGGVTEDLAEIRQMLAAMEEEDEEATGKNRDEEDEDAASEAEAKGKPFGKDDDEEDEDAAAMDALKSPGGEPPDLRKRNAGKGGKFGRDSRNYAYASAMTKMLEAMQELEEAEAGRKDEDEDEDASAAKALEAAMKAAGMMPMSPGMNSMEMMKGMLQKVMSMLMKNYGNEDEMAPGEPGADPGMDPAHEDEPQDLAMLKRLVKTMETRYSQSNTAANMAAQGGTVADLQLYRALAKMEQRLDSMEAAQGLITDSVKKVTKLLTDNPNGRRNLATDQGNRRAEDGKPVRKTMAAAGAGPVNLVDKYTSMFANQAQITVQEVDKALTEAGVTDNIQRMAVKHALADRLVG